ncbi:MAG: histidine kinase dimerization/phospho-acceptor domain-containing protein, partial [Bacillota bacterium]|nr:histidine kinase dimerization/phospho-acceptor domain-containing protein [Bacillota bacterium]
MSVAIAKNTGIHLTRYSDKSFSEEDNEILKRFAKVFEQSYTRFLDLQKAEAQAREAQIELGLERVRARAMAMQKSNELSELVDTVFKELTKLDFALTWCIINIIDEPSLSNTVWAANPDTNMPPESYHMLFEDYPFHHAMMKGWKERKTKYVYTLEGNEKKVYDEYLFNETEFRKVPEAAQAASRAMEKYVVTFSFSNFGGLQTVGDAPLSDANLDILSRFGKVFDLTYTRFNDLKQAEAQAREAKIEAALEKVRSRTMAMQRSDELSETAAVLFQEFKKLGEEDLLQITIGIYNEAEGLIEFNVTSWAGGGEQINRPFILSVEEPTLLKPLFTAWKQQKKSIVVDLNGQQLEDWLKYRNANSGVTVRSEDTGGRRVVSAAFFSKGHISFSSSEPKSPETIQLLERFAGVFDLTYTRFLDLKNAEAQARESQIQLALERIRARTMAMQRSSELKDAAILLFNQLTELGVDTWTCGYNIWDEDKKTVTAWLSRNTVTSAFKIPQTENPTLLHFYEAAQRGESLFVEEVSGETLTELYRYLGTLLVSEEVVNEVRGPGYSAPTFQVNHAAYFSYGYLLFVTYKPYPEAHEIFKRFAAVFDQTYTRFLDLQKAEAQAREAQIEASLERVRSKMMAMHNSSELLEVINLLADQFQILGFKIHSANFNTSYREKDWNLWLYNPGIPVYPDKIHIPYIDHPFFNRTLESIAKSADFATFVFTKEEKNGFLDHLYANTIARNSPEERKKFTYNAPGFAWSSVYLKNTALTIANYDAEPYTEEQNGIIRRFGNVFEQTYTRFLDLQKAEAQAREAQVEAALERVRAKAMGMHNSNDLSVTASMVFTELRKLGIDPIRCGVGLLNKQSRKAQLYSAIPSPRGDSLSLVGWVQLEKHPVLEKIYDSWMQQTDYFPELQGEQLQSYYTLLLAGLSVPVPNFKNEQKQYGHFIPFSIGCLYTWSDQRYDEDQMKILRRFATIIDLTFRRYLELQQSEANAKEAVKQAALDRVRAEIASMRRIADLDRITPLIWNELTILGIPFIRCGVFIMDDEQQLIHTFLSTPDGNAIASFHLPFNVSNDMKQVELHWRNKEIYKQHWDEKAFMEWTQNLIQHGAINSPDSYSTEHRPTNLYLHFVPFLQGMLYVGSENFLNEFDLDLVQNLADAFSTAYARYEDFNKLEAAKQQVEKTLVDLKQAQAQLVQSEKMASLGELTAGIAHEIQNPLNFVNNFSEVSNELLDEMIEELAKGNWQMANEIVNDVKQNLEKINHHGKRADSIVKGMLQHSRSSTGVKEPTEINALADEYLRLSYHG